MLPSAETERIGESKPQIGVFVLDTLTTGMYLNPLDALRELVQNSCDSIAEAEQIGIIRPGAGRIEIDINSKSRAISVRDNGTGLTPSQAKRRLMDVGTSQKDGTNTIGFRGIGRLASIAYCSKLIFQTANLAVSEMTTIEMKAEDLRALTDPLDKRSDELAEVLYACSDAKVTSLSNPQHFFEVRLEGIIPDTDDLLDLEAVRAYLCQVAPVDFDPQSFAFASTILQHLEQEGIRIPSVTIKLRHNSREMYVFKPYRRTYETGGGQRREVRAYKIKTFTLGLNGLRQCWGWFIETDLLGAIDNPLCAGFRIRKNNMAVGGPELFGSMFKESRFNNWYVGEIHILDENVVPNASVLFLI